MTFENSVGEAKLRVCLCFDCSTTVQCNKIFIFYYCGILVIKYINELISGEAKNVRRNNIFRVDSKPINRHGLVCMLLQNARSKSHLHFCIIYRIYESLNRLNLALFLLHFI